MEKRVKESNSPKMLPKLRQTVLRRVSVLMNRLTHFLLFLFCNKNGDKGYLANYVQNGNSYGYGFRPKYRWTYCLVMRQLFFGCLVYLVLMVLHGCASGEGGSDYAVAEKGSMKDYTGGMASVVLTGYGTILEADPCALQALVLMHDSGEGGGQEVLFDFSGHTEFLPVELDECRPGDEVEVTYFKVKRASGGLAGESLTVVRSVSVSE